MVTWDNLDTLASFQNLSKTGRIDLKKVMSGENGAERVKNYSCLLYTSDAADEL